MELMLDTANLERIRSLEPVLPFVGVTSNPSILKSEGRVDFLIICAKSDRLLDPIAPSTFR